MKCFDCKVVGKRIKELRMSLGLSQKALADELGVKQNAISRYENGARNLSIEILFNIAIALDTSADYLLGIVDFE